MRKDALSVQNLVWFWVPVILTLVTIFLFSSRPALHAASDYTTDFVIKKLAHFTEYTILSILLFRALSHTLSLPKTHCALLAVVLTILYAVSDEWHQSFVPGREPRVRDIIIDASGGIFGVIVSRLRQSTTG